MRMWDTLFKQKKPFMFWDELGDWTVTRWAFTDMGKMIESNEWYYTLIHFDPKMEPTPYSPFCHIIVNKKDLDEYFEEVPESQSEYQDGQAVKED